MEGDGKLVLVGSSMVTSERADPPWEVQDTHVSDCASGLLQRLKVVFYCRIWMKKRK